MDYLINSFYILYKRWIPAGDPKDEAVIVTSILVWLNVMTVLRFGLYFLFEIYGSFGWLFIVSFAIIYFIMYYIYTKKKRINRVIERNPLFFKNVYFSMFVLLTAVTCTVWMFLQAVFYVVDAHGI
jgi:hypothetical protein